jgi:hypothetical protein
MDPALSSLSAAVAHLKGPDWRGYEPKGIEKMTALKPLDPQLAFLDGNSFIFDGFGCFVSLSPDGKTIYQCSAMADGTPERNEGDARHMNWREVTAPSPKFLDRVNSLFGTAFQPGQFAGR